MYLMLRGGSRIVAGLAHWAAPRCRPQVQPCQRALLGGTLTPAFSTTVQACQSKQTKDYSLPNSSWTPVMMAQFNKYMEMSKDGTWKRVPSYRNYLDHMPGVREERGMKQESRMFLRNVDDEGKGFEYVMFLSPSQKRMVCVFQPGPYLEGPPGFAHGGSTATIMDSTLGGCAMSIMGHVMTANLNLNYKNPVPLGSVVLADCKIDTVEGRKVFVSGQMRSADGETLHIEATALFIQLVAKKAPQPPERSEEPSGATRNGSP